MTLCITLRELLERRYGTPFVRWAFVCWALKMGAHAGRQHRSVMPGKLSCPGLPVSDDSESSCRVRLPLTCITSPHKTLMRSSESTRALLKEFCDPNSAPRLTNSCITILWPCVMCAAWPSSLFGDCAGSHRCPDVHADLCTSSQVSMSPCRPGSAPILACDLSLHFSAQYVHWHQVTPLQVSVARRLVQNRACKQL